MKGGLTPGSVPVRCGNIARMGPVSRRARLLATSAGCCALLAVSGCKDDGTVDNPIELRGGERLAWDQAGDSPQQIESLTFRLYVSGNPAALSDIRCAPLTGAAYPCSGGLPPMSQGRHTLELTSVLHGVESTRSAPIAVNVTAGAAATSSLAGSSSQSVTPDIVTSQAGQVIGPGPARDSAAALEGTVACFAGTPPTCYRTQVLAAGLGEATNLVTTPDGRLLFVEGESRVRVIANDWLRPEPALVLPDGATRIVGLAIGYDFASSGSVFVAWTEVVRGQSVLNVTRYRELQGVLAQGAVIVTGLPFAEGAVAPLAVDSAGHLYVALPAPGRQPLPSAGLVLRFTRDGQTPRESNQESPIFGYGYSRPVGLVFDDAGARLWLTGEQTGWAGGLATLPTSGTDRPLPLLPQAGLSDSASDSAVRPRLLVANEGRLCEVYDVASATDTVGNHVEEVVLSPKLPFLSGVLGPAGQAYASVVTNAAESAVLRLR